MTRFKTSAALLLAGLAVTACGPETNGLTPASNPSLSSVNQPVVQRTDYVFDVAAGDGVQGGELDRLASWFDSIDLGYGDHVSIDGAGGYTDDRTRADIASVVGRYGLLLDQGAPVTAGAVQPGSVRVIVSRMTASVPGCPIWEDELVGMPERTSTNYGCATNSNLAAMIADPADLVRGREAADAIDPAASNKAIDAYRRRIPTGVKGEVKSESTGGGK